MDPSVQRGMVNTDAPLLHQFLQVPVADPVFAIPADAMEDDLARKMPPFERVHSSPTISELRCGTLTPPPKSKQPFLQQSPPGLYVVDAGAFGLPVPGIAAHVVD